MAVPGGGLGTLQPFSPAFMSQGGSDATLQEKIWEGIPATVWEALVDPRPRLGLDDSIPVFKPRPNFWDPEIYKHVDMTIDGLRRFFEVTDSNGDGTLSVDELRDCFIRVLNDWGLWNSSLDYGRYWDAAFAGFLQALSIVLPQADDGGVAPLQPLTFELYVILLRRFKLEIVLSGTEEEMVVVVDPADKSQQTAAAAAEEKPRSARITSVSFSAASGGGGRDLSLSVWRMHQATPSAHGAPAAGHPTHHQQQHVNLRCYDFNAKEMFVEEGLSGPRLKRFYMAHRAEKWAMRWIVLDSGDTANILRLAVKYQLHPLYVEDVIKLDRQRPRFYKYGGSEGSRAHYFLIFSLLRLKPQQPDGGQGSEEPNEGSVPKLRREPSRRGGWGRRGAARAITIEKSQIAVFASGPPDLNTVITLQGGWKTARTRCSRDPSGQTAHHQQQHDAAAASGQAVPSALTPTTAEQMAFTKRMLTVKDQFMTPTSRTRFKSFHGQSSRGQSFDDDDERTLGEELMDGERIESVLQNTAAQLQEAYSPVRRGDSNWMLWCLLDSAVKMLQPIVDAYRERLTVFQADLETKDALVRAGGDAGLLDLKSDLLWLQRRYKRLKPAVRNLMQEAVSRHDSLLFFQSVEDDLDLCIEDIGSMLAVAQTLLEEAQAIQEEKRTSSLNMFTIIGVAFIPLQFLTGYFGMNFQDTNGVSTIPLMTSPYGPLVFWIACLLLSGAFLIYLKWIKRWI